MSNAIKTMRERLELARFHYRNGRPAPAFQALADVLEIVVCQHENEEMLAQARQRQAETDAAKPKRTARPAADALPLVTA